VIILAKYFAMLGWILAESGLKSMILFALRTVRAAYPILHCGGHQRVNARQNFLQFFRACSKLVA
jgi:hypothetical protein